MAHGQGRADAGSVGHDTPWPTSPSLLVYPDGSTPADVTLVPITAGLATGQFPRLWLRTSFQVRLDESHDHLAVQRSVFALVIQASGRPAIRVEYDRDQGNEPDDAIPGRHRRSAAHVQIHGSSEELAYVQGLGGDRQLRGLERFHIPVGGRRFRPSLEDFIEFLWAERLISGMHGGWEDVLTRHRSSRCSSGQRSGMTPRWLSSSSCRWAIP